MTVMGGKVMPAGHTAGIFADMSLDGPEIGTLVAVIDRAKNLPNRRTMGKQDPYCAMRLGKEAKRTGTDKRGGQTPKWDQELRFTVHDSADYYKLKCSIFNDDKKTDLIGEAWIDLASVVVPGGGQNDMWHQLQSKGKYAGDVRMELTYYDTRSKSDAASERRRDKRMSDPSRVNAGKDEVVGPRRFGPRDVKRRPLPPDQRPLMGERPSLREPAHSAPPPQLHTADAEYHLHQTVGERSVHDSYPMPLTGAPISHYPNQQYPNDLDRGYSSYHDYDLPHAETHVDTTYQNPSAYDDYGLPSDHPDSDSVRFHAARSSLQLTPAQQLHHSSSGSNDRNSVDPFDRPRNRSSPSSIHSPYGSSPLSSHETEYAAMSNAQHNSMPFPRYSTSPVKSDVFRDSPLRQSISQQDVDPETTPWPDAYEDDGLPPPPPTHRSSLPASGSLPHGQPNLEYVQMPQPLNLGTNNRRMAPFDRSPLQNIEQNYAPDFQRSNKDSSPCFEQDHSYSPYSQPNYSPVNWRGTGSPQDRPLNGIENTPPSLRSGLRGSVGDSEESRVRNGNHVYPQPLFYANSAERRQPKSATAFHQVPQVEGDWQNISGSSGFKSPAQAMSPDPRSIPKRKAVSPHSTPADQDQGLNGVPFGPDSYDVFNPSSPGSPSVAEPEGRYETPEQAKEVARQHEVQKLREQGPIIGNDGRVIDPSDHLPTDTWAPEPGRKNRQPEVVVRYKTKEIASQAPNGYANPSRPARPHSIAGQAYGAPGRVEDLPTVSAQQQNARSRLQKRMPGCPLPWQAPPAQTHSSPIVPTSNHPARGHTFPSPQSNDLARPALSEYPVHARGHRASVGGSPSGPYGGPPPVPGKIPISPTGRQERYQRDGGMDALSAELSTIDIGGGAGVRSGPVYRGYRP